VACLLAASALDEFDPPLGIYHYRFAWEGAPVARADVEVGRDGDVFVLRVEGRTAPVLDLVYRVRYRGEARIDPVDLSLIESWLEEQKGRSRSDVTRLRVEEKGEVVVERTRRERGEVDRQETTELSLEGPVLDPFAFVLMARSVDWEVGVADYFQVVVEDELWVVGLNCIEQTVLEVAGERRPAWVVVPTGERLDDEEGDGEDDEPVVRKLLVYVSADASREVLAIRSETRFGTVSLELEAFSPEAGREPSRGEP
jgi:hypothetical protein